MPIAYQYNPQLVLVAAGFDAARGDHLGGIRYSFILTWGVVELDLTNENHLECDVTPEGYGQLTHLLSSLASGRLAILLEGGYNLESTSNSMTMCVRALLGDPLPAPNVGTLDPAAGAAIQRVIKHLRPYWTNLQTIEDAILDESEVEKLKISNMKIAVAL